MAHHSNRRHKSDAGDAAEKIFPMVFASFVALLVVAVVVGLTLILGNQ